MSQKNNIPNVDEAERCKYKIGVHQNCHTYFEDMTGLDDP